MRKLTFGYGSQWLLRSKQQHLIWPTFLACEMLYTVGVW